jgi:UDP-N-acetyl-2-amino-2-deoxyglucuronate dehydrogenase
MVNVNVFWTRPQSYYDDAPWRGRWDMDGGAFMNQASHYVDMVDWLVGPVDSVHAYTATLARDIEAEDSGIMPPAPAPRRPGQHQRHDADLWPRTWKAPSPSWANAARCASAAWRSTRSSIGNSTKRPGPMTTRSPRPATPDPSVYGFGHPLYYDNVINTLRGEAMHEVDGYEGLRSLEVLIAAYRSARDGVRVGLPLVF